MAEQPKIRDIGIIYLSSNIGITAAIFFLPLLMKEQGISDLAIGYLALPYSIALFISNSVFGKMTDNYGRKPFLLLGMLASGLTTGSYIFANSIISFGVIRFLNGVALGMFPAAIYAITSDRGRKMGELSSWRALGWSVGAIFNGVIAEILQLQVTFVLGAFLFFIGFLYALHQDTGGRVDAERQQQNKLIQPKPEYRKVIRHNWKIYLMVILRHGSGGAIWIYWTLFLQKDLALTTTQIGIVLAINTITQTVVMRYFGDRGDAAYMFLLGIFLSALSFLSFTFARNFLEICLTQVLLGISFGYFLVGGLRVAEMEGAKLGMVGTATGLFEASFSIAQIVGPILAVIIFSIYHTYTSLMFAASAITFVATGIYTILLKF